MTAHALRNLITSMGDTADWLRFEGHDSLADSLLTDALFLQVLAARQAAEEAAAQDQLPLDT